MNQFDAAIELQLDLLRADASLRVDVLRTLKKMERELIAAIAAGDFSSLSKGELNRQIKEVRRVIAAYYDEAALIVSDASLDVATVAAAVTARSISGKELSEAQLLKAVTDSLVQGATQGAWWRKQADDTVFRFGQAVRQGVANGETNQQIINRVRGFLDTGQRGAAALVQTSVATVASQTRQAVFDANSDIVKRYRAVATLDSNTCLICAPLDGLQWQKTGEPYEHGYPKPDYPLHFNCRCLLIAVVFDGPQGGQRASADGPVDASTTFDDWLQRQPPEKQDDILGPGRAKLYREGKITLTDLVTNGRPLTIAQLKQKYA